MAAWNLLDAVDGNVNFKDILIRAERIRKLRHPGAKMAKRAYAAVLSTFVALISAFSASAEASTVARPRVALVLSGGSALGLAHIGVIRELERVGIPIDMVLGTSMGALVGGLYAAGYSPDRMEALVKDLDWSRYFMERRNAPADRYLETKHGRYPISLGFEGKKFSSSRGLIKGQHILSLFSALTLHVLPTRSFDDLPVPYRAVAADIITGEKVVFSSGSMAEAMRASMSIPGIFSPYELQGRSLVDGGIADNMPVDVAREMGADIVIAVECRRQLPNSASELDSSFAITNQTSALFIEANMRSSREGADLLIRPDLSSFNRLSFAEAQALIANGESGAKKDEAAIRALAERIAATRPLVAPDDEPNRRAMRDPPVMDRLEIEAPSLPDEAVAQKALGALVGRPLLRSDVEDALDGIYTAGGYSLVKFDLVPEPAGAGNVGVVRIVAGESHKNEILLGGYYRGLISTVRSNEATALSALYFGDVFGKDSALFFESGLGSMTRAYAEYFQPLGPFYAMPYLRYQSQYDLYSLGRGLVLRADYRSLGGGLGFGLNMGKVADIRLGWTYDSALGLGEAVPSDPGAVIPATDRNDAAFLFLSLGIDDRPVSVFPERGFAADLRARWADPAFGGTTSFVAADLRWNAALPLSRRISFGFAGSVATDFSGIFPDVPSLPQIRLFDLRSGGMFYGLDPRPDLETGHHMLGLGFELRRKMGRVSRLFGGDIFTLANVSVATVYQNETAKDAFLPLRWNPSLGLGLRISRDFGALLAGGIVADSGAFDSFRPALSLQIGSQNDFPEDRR
jgi:NTE family protein